MTDKPALHRLPMKALWVVGKLLDKGAEKHDNEYADYLNIDEREYYDKAMRHLVRYGAGEEFDEDENCNITAAATDLLILLEKRLSGNKQPTDS